MLLRSIIIVVRIIYFEFGMSIICFVIVCVIKEVDYYKNLFDMFIDKNFFCIIDFGFLLFGNNCIFIYDW